MMDTDTTTNTPNTPPRVAAAQLPGRSNQDSPQRSAARRVREIMTRQQQHQSPSSSSLQHQQQQAPSNQYINTAQSLEFAINRLEERLRQIDNNEKEHHNSNQNENMVEAHMLTELVEIMLHPPTDVINGTYCWKGDDVESDNKNEGDDNEEGVTLSSTLLSATTTDDTNIVDLGSSNGPVVGGRNNHDASNKRDENDENKDVMMMQEDDDDDDEDDVSPRLPAIATTLINQNTPRHYSTLQSAKQSITSIGKSCPTRRVCQHPFRRNDIVWVNLGYFVLEVVLLLLGEVCLECW